MEREIRLPLWALLLGLLLGGLFLIAYGWSVKSTLAGGTSAGIFGRAAVQVASFPTKVKKAVKTLKQNTLEQDKSYRVPTIDYDESQFKEVTSLNGNNVKELFVRANPDYLKTTQHWRILVGVFSIDGTIRNAAIALDPELNVARTWLLNEEDIEGMEPRQPYRKFVHGFDMLSDGSIIFVFGGGVSLQRFDQCGEKMWAIPGQYHHAVTLGGNEEFAWSLIDNSVAKVNVADGNVALQFSMDDIIKANPSIDILQIRQKDVNDMGGNSRNTNEDWLSNQFHLNDVDPLPSHLVDKFPGFETDDLLISARSLNLIFVVDPDTLTIKWWRMGATRRQHDPDWGWDGDIIAYDNRMSRDFSRIISIDPTSFDINVRFEGESNNFYSRIRGKQQLTKDGTMIIASPQQGRVFEVDPSGEIGLEFINLKPGNSATSYSMSEAIILSTEASDFFGENKCSN